MVHFLCGAFYLKSDTGTALFRRLHGLQLTSWNLSVPNTLQHEKSGREDLNLRPPGPEPGESGLLKREETRGFLMLLIEPFARFPVQSVEVC
jgi:hypothetical protein